MFTIDNVHYPTTSIAHMKQSFSSQPALSGQGPVAVCLKDTATWLGLCLYARDRNSALFPMHRDTPLSMAKTLAKNAGCHSLVFHDVTTVYPVSDHPTLLPGGLIQMSSGTTGAPKFIHRSWTDIATEIDSYNAYFAEAYAMTPVIACPVTHSYGLISGVLTALARQTPLHIVTDLNPHRIIKTIQAVSAPLLYSSPFQLETLSKLLKPDARVHAVMTSGSVLSDRALTTIRARCDQVMQQYGCSETGCISINKAVLQPADMGCILSHLVVTAGESAGVPAEIRVHLKSDKGSTFVHTQDLGYFQPDQDGNSVLKFIARTDDTIIVSGLNVYPLDVENLILAHPQIEDAVAFGVEDRFAGSRVGLWYVAKGELEPHTLREWCLDKLASYQIPQYLAQTDQIPRLPNGKVARKKIAEQHKQQESTQRLYASGELPA